MNIQRMIISTFIVALFFTVNVSAQKHNKFTIAADNAFKNQKYIVAIDKYKKAYSKTRRNKAEKARISFQIAECYRMVNNVKRAELSYKRLVRMKYYRHNPIVLLYYADALRSDKKYDEAIAQYNAYIEKVPDDPRGHNGLKSCKLSQEWVRHPTNYEITDIRKINSRDDDFSPAFGDKLYKSLIFTSSREDATGKDLDEWTGQNFSDLFFTRIDRKGEWSTPVLLDENDLINTGANEGTPCLNSKFNTIYFTRCPNGRGKHGCQIYKSNRTGHTWSKPVYLPLKGGDSTFVFAHPALSSDELTIYFTSDIKGGFGGKDIWFAIRDSKNDVFKRPKNLGPLINTSDDEMFPFLRSDTVLYFASNGHIGMGGLDIFKTTKVNGVWGAPVNMKYPINSNTDDFAIIFNPDEKEEGYFCSNRKGGRGGDDIYYFIKPPLIFTLSGVVKDNRTLQYVVGASVKLVGSDGSSFETKTNLNGAYDFGKNEILPNTTYNITISKKNYFNGIGKETTVGLEHSEDFVHNFMLKTIPEEPIVLPEILFDLAKWDLKPQYQDSLQGLIQTLDNNENLVIELGSHTDSRDTEERNDILSQKRSESVVNYLILRGIDPDRLIAKGYGERVPRILKKDITEGKYTFKKGTTLTDDFINSLGSEEEKEAAHHLNRRTEFTVISRDFVPKPKSKKKHIAKVNIVVNPEENQVSFVYDKTGLMRIPCIINEFNMIFTFNKRYSNVYISLPAALKLLKGGAISKSDFQGNIDKVLAGGTITNNAIFTIKDFRIGSKTINDVEVTVSYQLKSSMILGDATLSKFGKYTIDEKKKKIIFK